MKLDLHGLLYAISFGLDCVERELVGVSQDHAKRVAYISVALGKELGLSQQELGDLAACAVLHDNALTQYMTEEYKDDLLTLEELNLKSHCIVGQKNIEYFPFLTNANNAILYHHENADGSGPFGKTAEETPLYAQLIHFGDYVDAQCDLGKKCAEKYSDIVRFLHAAAGTILPIPHVQLFLEVFNAETFCEFQTTPTNQLLWEIIPCEIAEYDNVQVVRMMQVIGKIIDFKSPFTKNHSEGIANKAFTMGRYYGYGDNDCYRLYVAGMLHDIGKLAIESSILEKPDRLTSQEFRRMQDHVRYTYEILSQIREFEDITKWASMHHEKLDGTGYPFKKTAENLGHLERLLACLDIYQALREKRSYKEGMNHQEAINILCDLARQGKLDCKIVEDIADVFCELACV